MPCSAAMRATTGETNAFPFSVGAATGGGGGAGAGVSATGSGVGSGSGAGSSAAGTTAPSPPMRASSVPTATVSPSCTRISVTTPLAGDGTSVSTLSVEISSSVSSAAIGSPTFFTQRVIVPSETDTPICGMTTSAAVVLAISTRSTPSVR
jgi:hypothetical protein